jgi:hypothetical protein
LYQKSVVPGGREGERKRWRRSKAEIRRGESIRNDVGRHVGRVKHRGREGGREGGKEGG